MSPRIVLQDTNKSVSALTVLVPVGTESRNVFVRKCQYVPKTEEQRDGILLVSGVPDYAELKDRLSGTVLAG